MQCKIKCEKVSVWGFAIFELRQKEQEGFIFSSKWEI